MSALARPHTQWTYEVHELSEGYSAIVYDESGWMVADHLTEERARLIHAAPEMAEALRKIADRKWNTMTQGCDAAAEAAQEARALLSRIEGEK